MRHPATRLLSQANDHCESTPTENSSIDTPLINSSFATELKTQSNVIGIGTDLIHTHRIKSMMERNGDRFIEKHLAPKEQTAYEQLKSNNAKPEKLVNFIAKRWAAKEAVVKAFGTGFSDNSRTCEIALTHDPQGKPVIELSGRTKAWAEEQGFGEILISLTDDSGLVFGFATALER